MKTYSEKTTQLLAEIAKTKQEINAAKEALTKKIRENFHAVAKELFVMYPELKSFGWRQYTPYFNDGEACEFRSGHDSPMINDNDSDYGYDDETPEGVVNLIRNGKKTYRDSTTGWKDVENPDYNPYYEEIITTVREFLYQFDDEDMEDLFGDHVRVRITEQGAETIEYDHD